MNIIYFKAIGLRISNFHCFFMKLRKAEHPEPPSPKVEKIQSFDYYTLRISQTAIVNSIKFAMW